MFDILLAFFFWQRIGRVEKLSFNFKRKCNQFFIENMYFDFFCVIYDGKFKYSDGIYLDIFFYKCLFM